MLPHARSAALYCIHIDVSIAVSESVFTRITLRRSYVFHQNIISHEVKHNKHSIVTNERAVACGGYNR